MATVETVRRLLLDAAGEPLCDDCLALACSVSPGEMRQITEDLATSPSFECRGRCVSCRRGVSAIAYTAKCVHCSRAVLPGEDALVADGDILHAACLTVLASDETIRLSRKLTQASRRLIEQARHRRRDERRIPADTATGREIPVRLARSPESPADNTVVLAKLLFEKGPVCAACISDSGVPISDIEPTAGRLQQTLAVKRAMGNCTMCGRWTLVYSLFGKPQR